MKAITFENGRIPLLNDAAYGISPTSRELLDYAKKLKINFNDTPLKSSGYRKFKFDTYEIVIDGGPIGPDYIPGHGHADITNFELQVNDQPFIVDTGTSTYERNERRRWERSTAAHNTVRVGNREQSETWSAFRVARRSCGEILSESDHRLVIALNSYHSDYQGVKRTFEFKPSQISIQDSIPHRLPAKAYFHFSPGVTPRIDKNKVYMKLGNIDLVGAEKLEIQPYEYAPEFNKTLPAMKLIVSFFGKLETVISL